MDTCFNCNGKGLPGGCTICGLAPQKVVMTLKETAYDSVSFIPEQYRVAWDPELLIASHDGYRNDGGFIHYVETLNKLARTIQEGKLPTTSALIMSSTGMGKTHLAYYCLAIAAQHGYKVAPIIDNVEYRRINNLSVDGFLMKQYLKRNPSLPMIEDVIESDLQFMYIDATAWRDSYRDIMSLITKRDRRGKATIILSPLTINQLTSTDWEGEFNNLLTSRTMSSQKALRVVQMFVR